MKTGPKPRAAASVRSITLTLKVSPLERELIRDRIRALSAKSGKYVTFADYCREFLLTDVGA
jgi:hypothetical protein